MKQLSLLTFLLVTLCFPGQAPADQTQRPNILWIYLEDVSGWFSCYGETLIETPNLDSLAKAGIRFDRFYTPAGVCSATRSATILGTMQTTLGVHDHRSSRNNARGTKHDGIGMIHLPEGVQALPEIFKAHGYYTFNQSGKDDYNFLWSRDTWYSPNSTRNRWNGRKKGQPFFGQLQLRGGKLGRRAKKLMDPAKVPVPPYYPDIELVRKEIAHHYDCLLKTDEEVGEVISALKRDGLYDNTLIFLFSDHGYKLHRHKQFLYEGGIHMPLIVAGRGIKPGQVRSDLVSGIDIAPASLAGAGLKIPAFMEGRDFLGSKYTPRTFLTAARDRCDFTIERIRAVVTPQFKYLRNYLTDRPYMQSSYKDPWPVTRKIRELTAQGKLNKTQLLFFGSEKLAEELYDLASDPHEIHNLATDPKYAGVLKRHQTLLADWIKKTGDKGQQTESDAGLLQVLYRWKDKCINPEYDKVRPRLDLRRRKKQANRTPRTPETKLRTLDDR